MSSKDRHEEEPKPPAPPLSAEERAAEAEKPKPYVFRFLPADPKNSLEFEDMADK